MRAGTIRITATIVIAVGWVTAAFADDGKPVRVTVDNVHRAESDMSFARFAKEGGFGKFKHERELPPIDNQTVMRLNRDTLYSFGVESQTATFCGASDTRLHLFELTSGRALVLRRTRGPRMHGCGSRDKKDGCLDSSWIPRIPPGR
jgi:hypothetical protein